MDENHQNVAGNTPLTDDNKLWTPPLSAKDRKKLDHLRKKSFAKRMGFTGKTPWDFIQLLLIPLVFAGIGYWFSFTQTQSNLQNSQRQYDTNLQITMDQQRETELTTCLNEIGDLLLNKNLRGVKPGDEVRVVARGDVLAALWRMDGVRRGLLMQYLSEAGLISKSRSTSIIDLKGADLSGADLRNVDLNGVDLSETDLSGAMITGKQLKEVKSLKGAIMPDGSKHP
ncbi:MAG TPA: pentapeptide repeat-containing protein [Ktedonobacteraceae bacterium]|jgi:hypothetical protein|nr:pentapeptide repeat-containing protein [Ktedonobacteraceae bacterium]